MTELSEDYAYQVWSYHLMQCQECADGGEEYVCPDGEKAKAEWLSYGR